jgi:hypothetical protein
MDGLQRFTGKVFLAGRPLPHLIFVVADVAPTIDRRGQP